MEVDMQPLPSFTRMSAYSSLGTKRARSFDEDSPSMRPMKRPSLAIDNISAQLFSSQPSSRQASEDWVQQTDGLRIGTPGVSSSPSPVVNDSDDVDMDQDSPAISGTPMSVSATPLPTNYAPSDLSSGQYNSQLLLPRIGVPPSIAILPPTPETARLASGSVVARPMTPLRESSMSMIPDSPTNVFASPRKQRFTMGPRSDCEKCRLGVKGHYSHFD
ncbi:hypothetical protein BDZ89DRAFT_1056124 [Hymenopellis radicata]|nr:hypothetical protein BDZ89DRAFT_1056124 [Hymenopellis radicata]